MGKRAGVLLVIAALALPVGSVGAASGGPDAFGYSFIDSNEAGGPAFDFEDIRTTGTPVLLGDDQVSGAIPAGFAFDFYGTSYANVYISSNGFLTVLPGQSNGCCTGHPLPNAASPNGVIAGYWEDLYPPGGGSIRYQTLGSAPARRFIVQFTDIAHYCCFSDRVTMQFKIFEATGVIEVHYLSAPSDGGTHTAGIENETGSIGLTYFRGNVSLVNTAVMYVTIPGPDAPHVLVTQTAYVGHDVDVSASTIDPNGHDIAYRIAWGDGATERIPAEGFVPSGTGVSTGHPFAEPGAYLITVHAENAIGGRSPGVVVPIEIFELPLLGGSSSLGGATFVDPSGGSGALAFPGTGWQSSQEPGAHHRSAASATAGVASLRGLSAQVRFATDGPSSDPSSATSSVVLAGARIETPEATIEVEGVSAGASASCLGASGRASVGRIVVDGVTIFDGSSAIPGTLVPVEGIEIGLYEQQPVAGGVRVIALRITIPDILDLVLGDATSSVSGCLPAAGGSR